MQITKKSLTRLLLVARKHFTTDLGFDLSRAIGFKYEPLHITATAQDLILYSLGIGFQSDPLNREDFKFTFEQHPKF